MRQLAVDFRVVVPDVDELEEGDPFELAVQNACLKESAARSDAALSLDDLVVAVDTIVVIDGEPWGKAVDHADAERMLRALRGRTHTVASGLAMSVPNRVSGDRVVHTALARTDVTFRNFREDVLADYLDRGEWRDRAGAYAIQHTGAAFIERIDGDYLNVVGFPVAAWLDLLDTLGITLRTV